MSRGPWRRKVVQETQTESADFDATIGRSGFSWFVAQDDVNVLIEELGEATFDEVWTKLGQVIHAFALARRSKPRVSGHVPVTETGGEPWCRFDGEPWPCAAAVADRVADG